MPAYRYKAYAGGTGRETSGLITAENEKQAARTLKEQGIYPKELYLQKSSPKKASPGELPFVTRELALLVASGVPILDCLKTLSKEAKGHWRGLLQDIAEDVSSGMKLSKALEQHPVFPGFYAKMVASAEASGNMGPVLKNLSDFLEEEAKTKARIKSALAYPLFMLAVAAVVLAFVFAFVMPKIIKIFRDSGEALPLLTKLVIATSNLFVHYWWAGLVLAILGGYALRRLYGKRRASVDRALLKWGLTRSLYLSRFARSLGFLIGGGLTALKALELSGPSSGNLAVEEMARQARQRLSEGAELSQALDGFPPVFIQLLSTAQKSGLLAQAVGQAAASYEEDFKRRLERALALLEPSIILAMGAIVGFIVLAVLLPIFELNQIIK